MDMQIIASELVADGDGGMTPRFAIANPGVAWVGLHLVPGWVAILAIDGTPAAEDLPCDLDHRAALLDVTGLDPAAVDDTDRGRMLADIVTALHGSPSGWAIDRDLISGGKRYRLSLAHDGAMSVAEVANV